MRCYKLSHTINTRFDQEKNIIYNKEVIYMKDTISKEPDDKVAIKEMTIALGKNVEEFEWRVNSVKS